MLDKFIFNPNYIFPHYFKKELTKYKYIQRGCIIGNKVKLEYILYNSVKEPSFDDDLIILFNGRDCNILTVLNNIKYNQIIDYCCKNGKTFFIFDYRSNGMSSGKFSFENIVYNDNMLIINYLEEKKVNINNTIIFGISLGSIIATYMTDLLCSLEKPPKSLILWGAIYSMSYLMNRHMIINTIYNTVISKNTRYNTDYKFNTLKLCNIRDKVNIGLIHGSNDSIVSISNSIKLSKLCNIKLYISYYDNHDNITITNELYDFIKLFF